jgi:hypothetical protein
MSALRGDYSQPKCINTLKAAITVSETALTEEITRTDVRSFMRDLLSLRDGARPRREDARYRFRYCSVIEPIRNGKQSHLSGCEVRRVRVGCADYVSSTSRLAPARSFRISLRSSRIAAPSAMHGAGLRDVL